MRSESAGSGSQLTELSRSDHPAPLRQVARAGEQETRIRDLRAKRLSDRSRTGPTLMAQQARFTPRFTACRRFVWTRAQIRAPQRSASWDDSRPRVHSDRDSDASNRREARTGRSLKRARSFQLRTLPPRESPSPSAPRSQRGPTEMKLSPRRATQRSARLGNHE